MSKLHWIIVGNFCSWILKTKYRFMYNRTIVWRKFYLLLTFHILNWLIYGSLQFTSYVNQFFLFINDKNSNYVLEHELSKCWTQASYFYRVLRSFFANHVLTSAFEVLLKFSNLSRTYNFENLLSAIAGWKSTFFPKKKVDPPFRERKREEERKKRRREIERRGWLSFSTEKKQISTHYYIILNVNLEGG